MTRTKLLITYVLSALFIICSIFVIREDKLWLFAFPLGILFVALAIFSLEKLLYAIVIIAPVSLQMHYFIQVDNDLSIPMDPLLFGILIIVILKWLFDRKMFDKKLLKHPVSIAIYLNLLWIFITSLTSEMPLISLKYTVSRIWFLVTFYLLAMHLFKRTDKAYKYFWLYIISFLIVIGYTLFRQNQFGLFDKRVANWVVTPFLPDHTSYATILTLILPFLIFYLIFKVKNIIKRGFVLLVIIIYVVALVLSYTRAAWLGITASTGIVILLLLKIRGRILVVFGATAVIVISMFFNQIMFYLEKNDQDSSDNLTEQIFSLSNISTDASNLERINRWNCALRMFAERPFVGFGPNTYMFSYAPYQKSSEKTIISTNSGDVGNAHSEYLGPLAESGILGTFTLLTVIILTGISAFKVYHKSKNKEFRLLAMSAFLGLLSYYVHGFFNNFLDIDKVSILFWGLTALIVTLDVISNTEKEPTSERITE